MTNTTYERMPRADVLHAADAAWWRAHPAAYAFAGERWTLDPELAGEPGMHQIDGVDEPGISEHPGRVHMGGNTGYQAIGLAALWGVRRIVLLGFDMKRADDGRLHWHPDHDPAVLGNPVDSNFPSWRKRLGVAAVDLRRLGIEVVNASRDTALACFERSDLAHALAR